jgi:endonuclease-3
MKLLMWASRCQGRIRSLPRFDNRRFIDATLRFSQSMKDPAMLAHRLQDTALRYFLEVVRTGSVSEAAARLSVSPSAVSRQVAGLEDLLSVPLFERRPRGMVPSPAGELLAAHARRGALEADRVVSDIQALQGLRRGLVRLYSSAGFAIEFLPRAIALFRARHPGMQFHLRTAAPTAVTQAVLDGDADIGLTYSRAAQRDIEVQHRQVAPVIVTMLPSHPLARHAGVTLAQMRPYPIAVPEGDNTARQLFDIACSQRGRVFEPALRAARRRDRTRRRSHGARARAPRRTARGADPRARPERARDRAANAGGPHAARGRARLRGPCSRPAARARLDDNARHPMKTTDIEPFFAALKAANPQPNTELEYTTPFELLTAVLLSAQATDVGVNKATRRLFPVAGTPQALLDLGLEQLESYIRTIGLYRTKARNLLETCRILVERHGGQVPRTREELEALPGVGRKTANVVLNVAFGQPTMAVDTHIFRVGNRTGLAPGKNPLAVEMQLLKRVPPAYAVDSHHWLILLGRYVCQARKPRCWECVVAPWCDYQPKTPPPGVNQKQ